jgi:predicted ATPase
MVPFIQRLKMEDFLSYCGQEVALGPLNVLIGPNGSGKSNLLEALALFQAAPGDLAAAVRRAGGMDELLWKGAPKASRATLGAVLTAPGRDQEFRLSLASTRGRLEVVDEALADAPAAEPEVAGSVYYHYQDGVPVLSVLATEGVGDGQSRQQRVLRRDSLAPDQSVLAQRRDPELYPEISRLGDLFRRIRLYRDLGLASSAPSRAPQRADLPSDELAEDGSNLALVLNTLQHFDVWGRILDLLKALYPEIEDVTTRIEGGFVQVHFREAGLGRTIPATRLSDGTLRFLCLLAILCHPDPPPVVGLEEPELGLHPDALGVVADLLLEASGRTQLVVTTHSEALVSALSDHPQAVLVCERDAEGSSLRRLEEPRLRDWLAEYSLGDLWRKGEIGGTRW